jgi:hypothetical protein
MSRAAVAILVCAACHPTPGPRPHLPLLSTAETSHWERTGHYDEAVQLCHDFARAYAGVTCDELGRTAEDRPIVAITIVRNPRAPFIYIQAGVHAGEIEGKDAGLWFLRDLLDGKIAAGALDAVNVVFVPCINPDGHERFGPNNRPNQRGPAEMGFRTNGERLNLNRDFMKADSQEIQAVLGVMRTRDPLVFVDLHTTDGAKFEHDIAIDLAPVAPRPDHFDAAAKTLSDQLVARVTALGHLPIGEFYPAFAGDDPASGFAIGEAPPRFSHVYASMRGMLGILVETHSWKPYAERAKAAYHTLQALFERAAQDAPAWLAASGRARAADQMLGGTELPVAFDNTPHTRELAFRGYAYDKRPSDLSGGTWIVYDETTPEIWHVPLRDELVAKVTVHVPKAGYIVEGGFAALAAPILERHGIAFERLGIKQPRLALDVFRATKVTWGAPYEGHTRATFEGAWTRESRTLDRGAIFVPIAQPVGRLVVHLLDPAAPDSLAQWGVFNTAFERKEYMEAYVAEETARALIAADPGLRAKFDIALAMDPELAKSPDKRLDWFYAHTPAWDERFNLLPVYRTDVTP